MSVKKISKEQPSDFEFNPVPPVYRKPTLMSDHPSMSNPKYDL